MPIFNRYYYLRPDYLRDYFSFQANPNRIVP